VQEKERKEKRDGNRERERERERETLSPISLFKRVFFSLISFSLPLSL